jgi:hypothetical protein
MVQRRRLDKPALITGARATFKVNGADIGLVNFELGPVDAIDYFPTEPVTITATGWRIIGIVNKWLRTPTCEWF